MSNLYKYCVFEMPNDNWAKNNGFDPRPSEDGTIWIGDRQGQGIADIVGGGRHATQLPSYASQEAKDFYNANKYLTHELAKEFTRTRASAPGGSDGFTYVEGE